MSRKLLLDGIPTWWIKDLKIKVALRDILLTVDFRQVGVGRVKYHLQKNFIKYFLYTASSYVVCLETLPKF